MSEVVMLGRPDGDHVRLTVVSYAHPGGLHVFDHNWLFAEVVARTTARAMRCHAFLRAEDFAAWGGDLRALLAGEESRAELAPVDPWVAVDVEDAEDGDYQLAVRARDGGSEKTVQFAARLDRVEVETLSEQVSAVARRFPVVDGTPTA